MGNMEFRYKQSVWIGWLGNTFLLACFFLPLLIMLADPKSLTEKISVGDYPNFWGVVGFLAFASLPILELWLFGAWGISMASCRITLSPSMLIIQAKDFPGRKFLNNLHHAYYLGRIPYESIHSIEINSWRPGVAKFSFNDGSYIYLSVRSLENYEVFVQQLRGKLTEEQIGKDLWLIGKPRRYKKVQMILAFLAIVPTVFFLSSPMADLIRSGIWNEELTSWNIRAVSADSDGTLWVASSNTEDGKTIWRLSENDRQRWILSKNICDCSAFSVSHDPLGFPRVFDDEESFTTIYSLNDSGWNHQTVEADFFNMKLHSMDTRVWGEQNDQLAYLDFTTNQLEIVPSPSKAISEGLKLSRVKVSQNGSLLATFSGEEKDALLFMFDGLNWSEPYPAAPEGLRFYDFYKDIHDTVWALTGDINLSELSFQHPTIGYYDVEKTMWVWRDLNKIRSHDGNLSIRDFVVDRYNRVWLTGSYRTQNRNTNYLNFVTVLDWADDELIPLVEYTDKNSNFKFANQFLLTENRIWIWDFKLFWQDISTEKLAAPVPSWLDFFSYFNFGYVFIFLLGQLFLLIINFSLEYK